MICDSGLSLCGYRCLSPRCGRHVSVSMSSSAGPAVQQHPPDAFLHRVCVHMAHIDALLRVGMISEQRDHFNCITFNKTAS